jgi:hypothetical protein
MIDPTLIKAEKNKNILLTENIKDEVKVLPVL